MLRDTHRFQVDACGRRFGKSQVGGHKLVPYAFQAYANRTQLEDQSQRMEYWIVGPEYSDAEKEFRVVYDALRKLEMPFDRPGTYNNPDGGQMKISLWDGRFIIDTKSARHPETLVGEGLHGVLMSEAAKTKEKVWVKFIRPMLADFQGWAWFGSTPEGRNWFYKLWQAGQDPNRPDWSSRRLPAWLNPYVYKTPTNEEHVRALLEVMRDKHRVITETYLRGLIIDAEILSLMQDQTAESFLQEIGADFSEFVGRVFAMFDEEIHVGDFEVQTGARWEWAGAVDYGFTNPNVWLLLQISPWGEVFVMDEVYEPGLSPLEFAKEIKRRGLCPTGLKHFYPDPSSPGDTRILEQELKITAKGGTGGDLPPRLDAIREALKVQHDHLPFDHPDRKPRLSIDRKCKMTIRDFSLYRYADKKADADANGPENPVKKFDHAPEALGRFYASYFGTPQKKARRTRVRAAQMG